MIPAGGQRRATPPGQMLLALMACMMAVFFPPYAKTIASEAPAETPAPHPQGSNSTTKNLFFMQQKLARGIAFFAVGNEPSWSLDLGKDHSMQFRSLTGPTEVNTPQANVDKAQDADVTRYFSRTDAGTLIATVSRGACADTMSGEIFSFRVRVAVKRTEDRDYTVYNGCGRYVVDVRINNSWTLTRFGDRIVKPEDFDKGPPIIEFQLDENAITGHTGCNRISGRFEVRGYSVIFGNLATTRMACPDTAFEQELLAALTRKTLRYTIDDSRLAFSGDTGIVLTFVKTD